MQFELQLTEFGALREDIFRSPTQRSGWAYLFSVCGAGLEDFCLFILKAHGLRSMGLFCFYIN